MQTEAQKRAKNKYTKNAFVQKNLMFKKDNEMDMLLLDHLNKQYNQRRYLKDLIYSDYKKGFSDEEIKEQGVQRQLDMIKSLWNDVSNNKFEFPTEKTQEWLDKKKPMLVIVKEMQDIFYGMEKKTS